MADTPSQELAIGRSFRKPLFFLVLAWLWAGVGVVVLLRYHIPEPPGVLSVTTNGHTYFGHPPALSVYERDPVSFATIVIILLSGLLAGATDLGIRFMQHSTRIGVPTIVVGGAVILSSVAGLLVGLVSVGVVGALLVVSSLSIRWPDKHSLGTRDS